MSHFDYFNNATITLTRTSGSRGASGYVAASNQRVFSRRGDLQESGRTLQQLQAAYDEGDVVVYTDTTGAQPGDAATIETDDDRTLEGSVVDVIGIDSSLVIAL